jgi:hypothetical protein
MVKQAQPNLHRSSRSTDPVNLAEISKFAVFPIQPRQTNANDVPKATRFVPL